ncbi:YLP motif containing protein [Cryptosporidium xiaoi]|uniref:YLP motif containing protein n=1 Tax=Cryptosporidium xiaoi TaxID=659607 RepID=A0AAV9Y1I4_9CRYT
MNIKTNKRGLLSRLKGVSILILLLLALVHGEENVNKNIAEKKINDIREWEHFKNVLELLLFQPGRGMGTPWPRRPPFEFMKLIIKNIEFCDRCKNLLDNWMNSEPNMILFRGPLYFSKIPHIFLVACGSLELRFTNNDPSDCTKAFEKFSLQKYYEGFSSAPTLRRRASFPATHTDYRPFKPKYLPLDPIQTKVTIRKSPDLSRHSYFPQIRKDVDAGSNRGYPYFHGIYPTNTTHGYVPPIQKNLGGIDNTASYPASRTGIPSDPNHGYIPIGSLFDDGDVEKGSLPSSRTRIPVDHTNHSYIPYIPFSNEALNETGSLPSSRTRIPVDHTNHTFIPYIPFSNEALNETGSLPSSRTKVPLDHTNHTFIPHIPFSNETYNETGSLPSSRTKVPLDHTNHTFIPHIPFSNETYNETGSLPSSRTKVPLDHTNHGYAPKILYSNEELEGHVEVSNPAYRTKVPTDRNHTFIPHIPFSNETYNETGSLPSSRTKVPLDHTNHGYAPKILYSNEELEGHVEVSNPAYRTKVPTDRNHTFIPYIPLSNETYNETGSLPSSRTKIYVDHTNHSYVPQIYVIHYNFSEVRASYPVSRTGIFANTSHLYIPLFELRNESLSNNTYYYGLPASRTSLSSIDSNTHGYIPVFQRRTVNETASYPASRIRIPVDNTNYTYIPCIDDDHYMRMTNNTASYPASRTGFPADQNHSFVPIFIKADDGYGDIIFSYPASRTGVQIYSNHSYIPITEHKDDYIDIGSLPSSRTRIPVDHTNHSYIPYIPLSNETYNETGSLPSSRTKVPLDHTNHTFIPYIPFSNETYNETGSLPSSRTKVPLDHTNHGYAPKILYSNEELEGHVEVSNPAYRTKVPTDRNHSYIPHYRLANETDYETGSLPSSRTKIPIDHGIHGFTPVFTRIFLNNTSFLPASRVGLPSDFNKNHMFIPFISKSPETEHAARPASRTSAPAPGTASCNLPFTILVSLPKAGLPASRTDLLSEDHNYVPLIQEKVDDIGPRAAFPASHTLIKAPEKWTQGGEGIEWEHYSDILKLDETGNPYVDTKIGRVYGFGDLGTILSQLEEKESIDGNQCIINQQ